MVADKGVFECFELTLSEIILIWFWLILIRYDIDPAGLLHIATVTVADEGVFECFVSNSAGNVTRRIDLQVQGKIPFVYGESRHFESITV